MDLTKMIIQEIISFIVVKTEKNELIQINNRSASALVFFPDGENIYIHNGNRYVCNASHVVFIPIGSSYKVECKTGGDCYLLNFISDEKQSISFDSYECNTSLFQIEEFESIEKFISIKRSGYIPLAMTYVYNMIYRISSPKTLPPPVLAEVTLAIENSFDNPELCNDSLAAIANISTVYFRKLFTKYYGIPPMEYVRRLRIEKAKSLLRNKNPYITEVATKCGFTSVNHFCRTFKADVGCTPTEYSKDYLNAYYLI